MEHSPKSVLNEELNARKLISEDDFDKTRQESYEPEKTPEWVKRLGIFIGYSQFPIFIGTGFVLGVAMNYSELNRDMHVAKEAVSTGYQLLFFMGGISIVIFGLRSGVRIFMGKDPF